MWTISDKSAFFNTLSGTASLPVLHVYFWINDLYAKSFFLGIIKQTQTERLKRNCYVRQRAGHTCESFFCKHLAAAQEHKYSKHFYYPFQDCVIPIFLPAWQEIPHLMKQALTSSSQCGTTWISTMPMVHIPLP